VDVLAWYDANSCEATRYVGDRRTNDLGLRDMSGNIGERMCSVYDVVEKPCTPARHGWVVHVLQKSLVLRTAAYVPKIGMG